MYSHTQTGETQNVKEDSIHSDHLCFAFTSVPSPSSSDVILECPETALQCLRAFSSPIERHFMKVRDSADTTENLGITPETHVVVYDTIGVFSSPRALYTFKAFNHNKVSVLDGGLPRWIHEGYEVETGDVGNTGDSEYPLPKGPNPDLVRSYEQIVKNSELGPGGQGYEVVLDHRPRARWEGTAPEPRPGLSSGHIPHSLPAPFLDYLLPSTDSKPYTSFKSPEELRKVLVGAVGGEEAWSELVKGHKNAVFTCGSGMTAAVGWLANEIIREKEGSQVKTSIYDEVGGDQYLRDQQICS